MGLWACAGEAELADDGGLDCPASQASGLHLLPFGPLTQEVFTGSKAKLSVIVIYGSDKQGEGHPQTDHSVSFRVITQGGDGGLESGSVVTNEHGLATATFVAGAEELIYQVEASSEGTCATTFSIDVRKPLRQLTALTPNPFDTFTGSRIPIVVEATTNSFAKLANEQIQFSVTLGQTSETNLEPPSSTGGGNPTLTLTTNAAGRATAMLITGSVPIPQLKVEASMSGTAPVEVVVRIAQGDNVSCQDAWDCPLAYVCVSGLCEPPPVTPPSGCQSDADCAPPTICQISTGQCLESSGNTCDPIEGTGCPPDEVCVGFKCAKLPTSCAANDACPPGWTCENGACVPGGHTPDGCITNADCPAADSCINGQCVPKTACNIPHAPNRLQGTWHYDSTLHLRDALDGFLKGILSAAGLLRDIIEGRFSLSGIPGFIEDFIEDYIQDLIGQYIPPWGQQLIITLGDVNDIVDDMRVLSTVHKHSVGQDAYVNNEVWDLVEFDYKGQKIATPPQAVPEIGQVNIPPYSAYEVCGVLFIDKHKLKNVVGGLIKWGIDTALSIATCNLSSGPCFNSVDQALQMAINCTMLALQIDQMVQSIWSSAPSVANIIQGACDNQKGNLINLLTSELNGLTTKLSLLELSGTANIPTPPNDHKLDGGKWFGVLAGGDFEGEFSAYRAP